MINDDKVVDYKPKTSNIDLRNQSIMAYEDRHKCLPQLSKVNVLSSDRIQEPCCTIRSPIMY